MTLLSSSLKYQITASKVPKWAKTSTVISWLEFPKSSEQRIKWAELDTGKNSVNPWSKDRKKILKISI